MVKPPKSYVEHKVDEFTDLRHLLNYGADKFKDKNYLTYKTSNGVESVTFGQMRDIIQSLGTTFYNMNFMGAPVAVISETRYEWIASYFAAANGGGVIVPLDKELSPKQIIEFAEISGAAAIVYSNQFKETIENYASSANRKIKRFINMDYTAEEAAQLKNYNIYSFNELVRQGKESLASGCNAYINAKIDPNKMCACIFTSGTTGTSKAVMLSHANLAADVYGIACAVDFGPDDRMVSVLPNHHTYETSCTYLATFVLGTEVCVNDSLKMVLRNFQFFKPTKLVLVPLFVDTMVKKVKEEIEKKGKTKTVRRAAVLSNTLRKTGLDLRRKLFKDVLAAFGGRLDMIICGGAPMNPDHVKTLDAFGIKLLQGYGTTECSPVVCVNSSSDYMRKQASVGFPFFGQEVRVDKAEGEEHGEILVRGKNVMLGYMNNERATKEVLTSDGFYRTGDIGYVDKDGYVYITGRKKNVVIAGNGKNVYPEEIEEYLSKCDLIAECAVVGRINKATGDVILAAVIFPDFDKFPDGSGGVLPLNQVEEKIKEEVNVINKQLPTYKHIYEVEIRDTEFEKTTSKKIIRYKIK